MELTHDLTIFNENEYELNKELFSDYYNRKTYDFSCFTGSSVNSYRFLDWAIKTYLGGFEQCIPIKKKYVDGKPIILVMTKYYGHFPVLIVYLGEHIFEISDLNIGFSGEGTSTLQDILINIFKFPDSKELERLENKDTFAFMLTIDEKDLD